MVRVTFDPQQMIVVPGADLFKKARERDNGFPGREQVTAAMSTKAEIVVKLVRPRERTDRFEVHAEKNIKRRRYGDKRLV